MKRLLCWILLAGLLLTGCARQEVPERKQYTATFLTLFDTITTIKGYADSKEAFAATAQAIHDDLETYHHLFDIYNEYEGMNNLKTINDQAGIAPVEVDGAIIRMLQDCRAFYDATDGKVNAAMGSVLHLWHEARSDGINDPVNAALPAEDALKQAGEHMDFEAVIIDEAASTVFITDPDVRLDVGAVAKGWAVQQAAEKAPSGLLISVGGNVCATGAKDEKGTAWVVGIQNPDDPEDYLHGIYVTDGCVITSGDYQRTYQVEGKSYHHIIDPETLYPASYWRAVTIVCADSGVGDALSTALFLLPQAQGQALLDLYGAEALWVAYDGTILYSPGFQDMIRT